MIQNCFKISKNTKKLKNLKYDLKKKNNTKLIYNITVRIYIFQQIRKKNILNIQINKINIYSIKINHCKFNFNK